MKHLLLILTLFAGLTMTAQDEDYLTEIDIDDTSEQVLATFISKYFEVAKTLDIDQILDITHPGLFEIAPRELIKEQLESAFVNDYFTMAFTNIEYVGVEDAYTYQNTDFFITKYNNTFTMTFQKSDEQTDEAFESYMDYLMELYTIQFKDDKVERNGNNISISGIKRLLIVDDPAFDGLKMLEIKPGMNGVYGQFIPEIVVNALGNG